ncbi:MAG: hypothetical protein DLM70_17870 [Chloroflexi bacterium]|nr:MAG: hypothetical protein DLM70_17870 [Chloroflexota bacterium]
MPTRRGLVTIVIGLVLTAMAVSARGAMAALALPMWFVIGWLVAWIWETSSDRKSGPSPSRFARPSGSPGLRTTLRQDPNAHFVTDSRGFLFRRRFWFEGTGCPPVRIPLQEYRDLQSRQARDPVMVAAAGARRYWWWEDSFWWENQGYESLDVKALVSRSRRQSQRTLQHAHALLAGEKIRARDPIPEDVRRYIWKRDRGQCQQCGATELLQYDHIIPWSMGGSNTVENLSLLCAECNRLKGDAI